MLFPFSRDFVLATSEFFFFDLYIRRRGFCSRESSRKVCSGEREIDLQSKEGILFFVIIYCGFCGRYW